MEADQEKALKEAEEKKKNLSKIARIKYGEEKETIHKKSYTSFGKLILADEKTNPVFSFGNAKRFSAPGDIGSVGKDTPGPYLVDDKFKFKEPPKWKIGTGSRPPIYKNEIFDHYQHGYDDKYDFSKQPKKWQKTRGGAMSLEPRIKYDFREAIPGPGRYEPDIKPTKQKAPSYYIGEKSNFNSLNLLVGTNEIVGPGTYKVVQAKKTSKHTEPPKWSVGKAERQDLTHKTWTKNETYHLYSSVGDQIMSRKTTEPRLKMGKADRERDRKLGMFPSMMSKQATKVRIEHPKIY